MTNLAIATAALPEAAVEFPLECRASFCPGVAHNVLPEVRSTTDTVSG